MTESDIKPVVFRLLKNVAPDTEPEKLEPGDNIRETLMIDSFDSLQFMIALDEELGIRTPEEDYGKIQTLRGLLDYIIERKK